MSERNESCDGLLLHAKEGLSGSRIVNILTAEQGLIDVFVFGGAKSTLRSLASPFVLAKLFLYSDNIKNYKKLNDLAIIESFPGLRETYERLLSAEVVAEFILKTSACGGEYRAVLSDALTAFHLLQNADDSMADTVLCCFLWRMLAVLGLEPDLDSCIACDRGLARSGHSSPLFWYSEDRIGFVCSDCADSYNRNSTNPNQFEHPHNTDRPERLVPVDVSLQNLLGLFSYQGFEGLRNLSAMDQRGLVSLPSINEELVKRSKRIVFSLAQSAAEGSLLTLKA